MPVLDLDDIPPYKMDKHTLLKIVSGVVNNSEPEDEICRLNTSLVQLPGLED